MGRILLVSNRLPITIQEGENGQRHWVRSAGGLVAALGPLHEQEKDSIWLGACSIKDDDPLADELRANRLTPIACDEEDAHRHYAGYSNQVLWPLCHYLTSNVAYDSGDYGAYERVNTQFCEAICAMARPDDTIWVHDYHLMLLPAMLRERLPHASIGFFLHIPFPSSEVFRLLPRKDAILRGLIGANLIGLHTYDYARHLLSSFRRVLGINFDDNGTHRAANHACRIAVFPLGVNVHTHDERARSEIVENRVAALRQGADGRRLVLGVDRMDYTKGLPLRLDAYRRFLSKYPRWHGKVTYMQVAVPSRSEIQSYQDLKVDVERRVGEINGAFEMNDCAPVHYLYRSIPPEELAALYRAADVAFVTPLRDGMNLVAKEYVASRVEDNGVLVLSEFAGAASELTDAVMVNPWDIDGTADALCRALDMVAQDPEEVTRRMQTLRRRVRRTDVSAWASRFLSSLDQTVARAAREVAKVSGVSNITPEWTTGLEKMFANCRRAVLALDYDGTLMELQSTPQAAVPTPELRELLSALSGRDGVEVVIISGRNRGDLQSWLGDLPLHLVAEHGATLRMRDADAWEETDPNPDDSWKETVRELFEHYTDRSPGALVEEKPSAMAWHYRRVEPGLGTWHARELMQHLTETLEEKPVEVVEGHMVVEVRRKGANKGAGLRTMLKRFDNADFVMVAGDDRTDEDAFGVAPQGAWTVKIGEGVTRAQMRLASPKLFRSLLQRLKAAQAPPMKPSSSCSPTPPVVGATTPPVVEAPFAGC